MQHGDNKWIEGPAMNRAFIAAFCDGPFSWGVARLRRAPNE